MSYTYPEALSALESIANDYIRLMRPLETAQVRINCDAYAKTASVRWDVYGIHVNMPVRPAVSVMTQAEFEDWTAYLLHELGHPTHTDKTVWETACRQGLGRMVNALEDVRMEKAVIASGIVPNAKAVLSRLVSRKVTEARAAGGWKPNARREFGWTVCVLGRAANGYALDASDLAWIKSQIKSGSTVETLLGWVLPALDACASTADCLDLAERISKVLASQNPQGSTQGEANEQGPDMPVNPGNGTGEAAEDEGEAAEGEGEAAEGEGEAAEGKGEGEGEGEGEGGPEGADKGEGEGEGEGEAAEDERKGPQNENEGDGAGKGGQGHGDGTTDADEIPVTSEKELVEHDLAPEGETLKGEANRVAERTVISILRDSVMRDAPRDSGEVKKLGAAGIKLRDAAAQASRQRAQLARALRANETDERQGGRKAGRLDVRALSRAVSGAPNVFARREISEGYDTDVCVLLDASGSMGGWNMSAALEVGLVIAQAAGSVGASCTTEIFNSTGYRRAGALASKRVPLPADYGHLVNAATGGTPLSAHMARAAVSQAKRAPHKRRVVFVVTDGGCDYGPRTVKAMAKYLEQACGTVLAHVSIGTPLQGSFRAEVCVPRGAGLAQVGLDHFVKVLQAL